MKKNLFEKIYGTLENIYYSGYFATIKRYGYVDPKKDLLYDPYDGFLNDLDEEDDDAPCTEPKEEPHIATKRVYRTDTGEKVKDEPSDYHKTEYGCATMGLGSLIPGTVSKVDDLERHLVSLHDEILSKIEGIEDDTTKILVNMGFQTNMLSGKRPTDCRVENIDPINLFSDELAKDMRDLYATLVKGRGRVSTSSPELHYNRIDMTFDQIDQVLSKGIFIINLYLDGYLIPSEEYTKRLETIKMLRNDAQKEESESEVYDDAEYLHKPLDSE